VVFKCFQIVVTIIDIRYPNISSYRTGLKHLNFCQYDPGPRSSILFGRSSGMSSTTFCCCCLTLNQATLVSICWSLVYSIFQLFSILNQEVTVGILVDLSSFNNISMVIHPRPSHGSVLQPPSIDEDELRVFHWILLMVSLTVFFSCILLVVGIIKHVPYLYLPWLVTTSISIISEVSICFFLLTHKKTIFSPVSTFIFTLDIIVLIIQVYSLSTIYSKFMQCKEGILSRNRGDLEFVEFELSSRVATTTPSLARNNSLKEAFFRGKRAAHKISCRRFSLSKISEEDSVHGDEGGDNNKVCDTTYKEVVAIIVSDDDKYVKEIMSDKTNNNEETI